MGHCHWAALVPLKAIKMSCLHCTTGQRQIWRLPLATDNLALDTAGTIHNGHTDQMYVAVGL